MSSTLAQLRDRVELLLSDTGNAIYSADLVDQCLRKALAEYNQVNPQSIEAALSLPSAGREISLASLGGLLEVIEVWWPFDSTAATETWPPNRVRGWRVYWDNANPVLCLDDFEGDQPQADEEVRIWYTANQTINGLDSETVTTVRADHESILVTGAAAYAALARAHDLIETAGTDLYQVGLLGSWGQRLLRTFYAQLEGIRENQARRGLPFGEGWKMDRWG